MPVDNWLILALIMIFSSIIFCGLLPMIIRLLISRHRYRLELQQISCTTPDGFLNLQSFYHNIQIKTDDNMNSHERSVLYSQIPFIDDLTKQDDTSV